MKAKVIIVQSPTGSRNFAQVVKNSTIKQGTAKIVDSEEVLQAMEVRLVVQSSVW